MRSLLFSFFVLLGSSFSQAGQGPLLVGGVIGDPTGVSGKYDLEKNVAIDGALSYSLGGRSGAQIHSDYLKIQTNAVDAGDTELDLYYGIGFRMVTLSTGDDKGKLSVGPRVPVGLRHEIKDPTVEFFGELAFILDLAPSTAADLDIGVGARYRF
jgi:hypothetical protein